jgi:hypothetical protein
MYALDVTRAALRPVLALFLFGAVLPLFSIAVFAWALRRTKTTGNF